MISWKRIILTTIAILTVLVIGGGYVLNFQLDNFLTQIYESPTSLENQEASIFIESNESADHSYLKSDKNYTLALLGLDCNLTVTTNCRSDVIMVLSYQPEEKNLVIASVARDTLVNIPDNGYDKINRAYSLNGPKSTLETLNNNFDLNLEHYLTVDFDATKQIINSLGGVYVSVNADELPYIRKNTVEGSEKVLGLEHEGYQLLTGEQALDYMRIRIVGNGDFQRMERQRKVISSLLNQYEKINLSEAIQLINVIIPYIKTNLDKEIIIEILTKILFHGMPTITQSQIPSNTHGTAKYIDNYYYFVPNSLLETTTAFHHLLYPKQTYTPSENIITIHKELESYLLND